MKLERPKCHECSQTITWKSLQDGSAREDENICMDEVSGRVVEESRFYCASCVEDYRRRYPPIREEEPTM